MSLQNFQYDIIMREYSRRQSQVQNELEEHRKEAFQKVPRLLEIDQTVASLSAEKIRTMLQGHHGSLEDLKEEIAVLADERKALLRKNGFSPGLSGTSLLLPSLPGHRICRRSQMLLF